MIKNLINKQTQNVQDKTLAKKNISKDTKITKNLKKTNKNNKSKSKKKKTYKPLDIIEKQDDMPELESDSDKWYEEEFEQIDRWAESYRNFEKKPTTALRELILNQTNEKCIRLFQERLDSLIKQNNIYKNNEIITQHMLKVLKGKYLEKYTLENMPTMYKTKAFDEILDHHRNKLSKMIVLSAYDIFFCKIKKLFTKEYKQLRVAWRDLNSLTLAVMKDATFMDIKNLYNKMKDNLPDERIRIINSMDSFCMYIESRNKDKKPNSYLMLPVFKKTFLKKTLYAHMRDANVKDQILGYKKSYLTEDIIEKTKGIAKKLLHVTLDLDTTVSYAETNTLLCFYYLINHVETRYKDSDVDFKNFIEKNIVPIDKNILADYRKDNYLFIQNVVSGINTGSNRARRYLRSVGKEGKKLLPVAYVLSDVLEDYLRLNDGLPISSNIAALTSYMYDLKNVKDFNYTVMETTEFITSMCNEVTKSVNTVVLPHVATYGSARRWVQDHQITMPYNYIIMRCVGPIVKKYEIAGVTYEPIKGMVKTYAVFSRIYLENGFLYGYRDGRSIYESNSLTTYMLYKLKRDKAKRYNLIGKGARKYITEKSSVKVNTTALGWGNIAPTELINSEKEKQREIAYDVIEKKDSTHKKEKEELVKKINDLEKNFTESKAKCKTLLKDNEILKGQNVKIQKEKVTLNQRVIDVNNFMKTKLVELSSAEKHVSEMEYENSILKRGFSKLRVTFGTYKKTTEKRVKELERANKELNTALQQNKTSLQLHAEKEEIIKTVEKEYKLALEELNINLTGLNREKRKLDAALTDAKDNLEKQKKQNDKLKKDIGESNEKIASLAEAIKKHTAICQHSRVLEMQETNVALEKKLIELKDTYEKKLDAEVNNFARQQSEVLKMVKENMQELKVLKETSKKVSSDTVKKKICKS